MIPLTIVPINGIIPIISKGIRRGGTSPIIVYGIREPKPHTMPFFIPYHIPVEAKPPAEVRQYRNALNILVTMVIAIINKNIINLSTMRPAIMPSATCGKIAAAICGVNRTAIRAKNVSII